MRLLDPDSFFFPPPDYLFRGVAESDTYLAKIGEALVEWNIMKGEFVSGGSREPDRFHSGLIRFLSVAVLANGLH